MADKTSPDLVADGDCSSAQIDFVWAAAMPTPLPSWVKCGSAHVCDVSGVPPTATDWRAAIETAVRSDGPIVTVIDRMFREFVGRQ